MISSITSLKIVPAAVQPAVPIVESGNRNMEDNEIVDFVADDYMS